MNQRLQYLFRQQLLHGNTSAEKNELLILMADPANEEEVKVLLTTYWEEFNAAEAESESVFQPGQGEEILTKLLEEHVYPAKAPVRKLKLWPRIAAVAAAVAIIVSGVYFFKYNNRLDGTQSSAGINDFAPGKVGATLTLANGKKIKLSDAANGEIAKQAGISVTKTADGQLVYEINPSLRKDTIAPYNTLSTAKGETYILTLPDKSKVWLNAASSLTYSAALNEGRQRRVKLSGEAYFEIAKDKVHPFIVESAGQEVKVLGTHFNVNAYSNEPVVRTTLLEGSVAVTLQGASSSSATLKPGQQAILQGNALQVARADTELAVAWKNNEFMFESQQIENIMKMVERWYNVDVIYQGEKPTQKYSGSVSRFDNVSHVLRILESSGKVHFKIEGRKIYVSQ